jgi:hypothetical protein
MRVEELKQLSQRWMVVLCRMSAYLFWTTGVFVLALG